MKKMTAIGLTLSFAVGAVILTSQDADARPRRFRVNQRQQTQQNRIDAGVSNGSLTQQESARLQTRDNRLAAQEARFRASGNGLNPYERARLQREQNLMNKSIYRQKHDQQMQTPAPTQTTTQTQTTY